MWWRYRIGAGIFIISAGANRVFSLVLRGKTGDTSDILLSTVDCMDSVKSFKPWTTQN